MQDIFKKEIGYGLLGVTLVVILVIFYSIQYSGL